MPPATPFTLLTCPLCGQSLTPRGGALSCATAHSFDVSRQGYVNHRPGGAPTGVVLTNPSPPDRTGWGVGGVGGWGG
ncbi:putative RNA methyltransferase, partial [Streptomyces sp. NPDC054933]